MYLISLSFKNNFFNDVDTFGYVADVGKMTTADLPHTSFANNLAVSFSLGCTGDTRVTLFYFCFFFNQKLNF